MSETPKVSIIVPVYNAGAYLQKCLDSLVNQTLREIEIILVLDCPTDGSDKVAEEYAGRDNRIRIIRNAENLHTGLSRNKGIEAARGEYIGFTDHDDFCEPEMFASLYESAVSCSSDIAICDFMDDYPDRSYRLSFPEADPVTFRKEAFLSLIRADYSERDKASFRNMNVIWNQIFRRELLVSKSIFFPDNRVLTMEDSFFSIEVYHFADKAAYIPRAMYHHVNTSFNTYDRYDYRSVDKVLPLLESIRSFLVKNHIYEQFRSEFLVTVLKRLYSSFRNELKHKGLFSIMRFVRKVRSFDCAVTSIRELRVEKNLFRNFSLTKRIFAKLIV